MSKALLVRSEKKKKKERKASKKSSERCQGFSEDEKNKTQEHG